RGVAGGGVQDKNENGDAEEYVHAAGEESIVKRAILQTYDIPISALFSKPHNESSTASSTPSSSSQQPDPATPITPHINPEIQPLESQPDTLPNPASIPRNTNSHNPIPEDVASPSTSQDKSILPLLPLFNILRDYLKETVEIMKAQDDEVTVFVPALFRFQHTLDGTVNHVAFSRHTSPYPSLALLYHQIKGEYVSYNARIYDIGSASPSSCPSEPESACSVSTEPFAHRDVTMPGNMWINRFSYGPRKKLLYARRLDRSLFRLLPQSSSNPTPTKPESDNLSTTHHRTKPHAKMNRIGEKRRDEKKTERQMGKGVENDGLSGWNASVAGPRADAFGGRSANQIVLMDLHPF
ncbi:hypothetical protein HK102_007547, partial [Quaeritorhiza haematococci]